MTERRLPATRRGSDAVEAAIEEFEVRGRIDEPDASVDAPGDYDLAWLRGRIDTARRAAEADVVSADEALDWLASEVARDLPEDRDDEAYDV